jgi:hypothetical protein
MTPDQIADALSRLLEPTRLHVSAPLAPFTTFRIGGPADVLFEATSADELSAAVTLARTLDIPWFVLGLGANVLIGDRGVRGLVIRNHAAAHTISDDGVLWAESGAVVQDLVLETVRRGWSGLEHYVGIPSTVGGALWQNLHFLSPARAKSTTKKMPVVWWMRRTSSLATTNRSFTISATSCSPPRSSSRAKIPLYCIVFYRRTSRGAGPGIRGWPCIRVRARSSRRSRAWARVD